VGASERIRRCIELLLRALHKEPEMFDGESRHLREASSAWQVRADVFVTVLVSACLAHIPCRVHCRMSAAASDAAFNLFQSSAIQQGR
jgi:hypothetical protein